MDMKTIRPRLIFSESTKRAMIEDYLSGTKTQSDIWRQYSGRHDYHGQLATWMQKFGYREKSLPMTVLSLPAMPDKHPQPSVEELQKKVKELEQQLLDSQLKEEAYRRMIDIAEKELKVSIRKKPNTK